MVGTGWDEGWWSAVATTKAAKRRRKEVTSTHKQIYLFGWCMNFLVEPLYSHIKRVNKNKYSFNPYPAYNTHFSCDISCFNSSLSPVFTKCILIFTVLNIQTTLRSVQLGLRWTLVDYLTVGGSNPGSSSAQSVLGQNTEPHIAPDAAIRV